MLRNIRVAFATCALSVVVLGAGCSGQSDKQQNVAAKKSQPTADTGKEPKKADEHGHKPGAHGGIVVEIGKDNYHAEAVFEKGGILRFFTLGKDEAMVQEVDAEPLTAYVKVEGETEATSFVLRPEPQAGDAQGKTSQFLGHVPREMAGKRLEVTIPSIRIGGDRFRVGFKSASDDHGAAMPSGVSAEEERKLYLTPGGKYTLADIKANGNQTASQKFKGLKATHDLRPKPGDKICPVTLTKANPQFSWIIGGKTYEFCCPPCVDEFVALAKENPDELKEPEYYRKK